MGRAMNLDILFNNPLEQLDELALEAKKLTKKRDMRIIEIGNKHFRVNGDLEIVQEVYWNETFEEWTPVLWEQEMER
jgi:hypothetical protein